MNAAHVKGTGEHAHGESAPDKYAAGWLRRIYIHGYNRGHGHAEAFAMFDPERAANDYFASGPTAATRLLAERDALRAESEAKDGVIRRVATGLRDAIRALDEGRIPSGGDFLGDLRALIHDCHEAGCTYPDGTRVAPGDSLADNPQGGWSE